VWVAKSGGDHTTLTAAMASITDASATKSYLIRIAPGTYDEPGGVVLKSFVDIEGSGPNTTVVRCACSAVLSLSVPATVNVRQLTVRNDSSSGVGSGIELVNATGAVSLTDLTVIVTGTATFKRGIYLSDSAATITDTHITVSDTGYSAFGIALYNGTLTLERVRATASGGTSGVRGVSASGSRTSRVVMRDVTATANAPAGGLAEGTLVSGLVAVIDRLSSEASGGAVARGLYVDNGVAVSIENSSFAASAASSANYGVEVVASGLVAVSDSFATGTEASISGNSVTAGQTVNVVNTHVNIAPSGVDNCLDVYNGSLTPVTCT
jgi:hypothetical protein